MYILKLELMHTLLLNITVYNLKSTIYINSIWSTFRWR